MNKWFKRYKPFYEVVQAMFRGKTDVLVVGANDGKSFDPIRTIWNKRWSGVYVEPDPTVQEALQNHAKGMVLPFAVGPQNGVCTLYTVHSAYASAFQSAAGFRPSIITSMDKNHVLLHIRKYLAYTAEIPDDQLVAAIQVPAFTVKQISSAFNLNIGIAQIDVEGLDEVIAKQALDCKAGIVLWEHEHLTDAARASVVAHARKAGYNVVQMKTDTFAYQEEFKRSKKFPRRWDVVAKRFPKDARVSGVEVGVWEGKMSGKMLEKMPGLVLGMVDRWQEYSDQERQTDGSNTITNVPASFWDEVYQKAIKAVSNYQDRVYIIRQCSVDAAKQIDDNSLDFVFIDAGHSYQAVTQDIRAWLPKVKPGGWVCGHDYIKYDGVRQAVDEKFPRVELDHNDTWFWRKA